MTTLRTRLSGSVAGIGFGLLTWSIAHIATLTTFAHIHPGFVIHYHGWAGPLAIAGLMLTVTSVVAASGALLRHPHRTTAQLGALNGLLAPAVFVGVEFVEYLTGVHEAPPAALLVIGCLVHATIGLASPALWATCLRRFDQTVVAPFSGPPAGVRNIAVRPRSRVWATGTGTVIWGSRAPPFGRGSTATAAC